MPPTTATVSDPKPHHPSAESAATNDDLPAPSAADNESQGQTQSDDAATTAASEELRHTTISDKVDPTAQSPGGSTSLAENKDMGREVSPKQDELRERLSSPKKKRGRDLEDDARDVNDTEPAENGSTTAGGAATTSRTSRSEPEKKRPRDSSEETATATTGADTDEQIPASKKKISVETENSEGSSAAGKHVFGSGLNDKPQSSSAFMNSGFGALSSSTTSPFGTIGASSPSVFGGSPQNAPSGFGALAAAKQAGTSSAIPGALGSEAAKPATSFAFGVGSPTSGFGALGGSTFGSAIGGGFAGGSGPKLSSFAAPGKVDTASSKPAKPFGAPDSDEDDEDDEDGSEAGADGEEEGSVKGSEDKKKSKAVKTHIEDGESGEATLLQIRAKLFAIDSKEKGWQERGVGTLKLNVPESCASFDDSGVPIPGSFDISGLEEEEDSTVPRVPRLIMRQESTHRVILNTIIVRAMEFQDKPSTTGAKVLFTALENDNNLKPISMLLKMSESNFKLFRSEIDSVQHEL